MIPANPYGITILNTSFAEPLIPFFISYYGLDLPMDIEVQLIRIKSFKISNKRNGTIGFKADISVLFWVHFPNGTKELGATMEFLDIQPRFSVVIEQAANGTYYAKGHYEYLHLGEIWVTSFYGKY